MGLLSICVLGTGGNAAGIVTAGLVIPALLAVWAAALAACFATLSGDIAWSTVVGGLGSNPLSGAPSQGLAMLGAVFPFRLAVALTLAYITFRLTLIKLTLLAVAAIKALVGS